MSELDPGLQSVIDRLALTPTESLRDEFWHESYDFDLQVKRTGGGRYVANLYIDIDRYLEVTSWNPHMLADLLRTALPKGTTKCITSSPWPTPPTVA